MTAPSKAFRGTSDTVDSLECAGAVLKDNIGSVQGHVAAATQAMVTGVEPGVLEVVHASWVRDHERSAVQSSPQSGDNNVRQLKSPRSRGSASPC